MTKTEQARLSSWRLKVLERAAASSRSVARTCRRFGSSAPRSKPPYASDAGLELPRYASTAFAEPRRFAGRVTYETASNPSNTTGNNDFPSAAR